MSAAPPNIPRTNEVGHYEREQPVFQSKQISKERGDALLSALDGGRQIQEIGSWRLAGEPPGCILPVPAHHWVSITRTNGSAYRIGVSFEGSLVYLPEGLFEVREAAYKLVAKAVSQLDDDLRGEIMRAPKPVAYTVGIVDDGGTLSGIARLFYGDGSKWSQIYEANRKTIKNPDVINGGMKLTIPKLK
jgi:nucleoid-associated protein YgaU